jgi:hypothetical protein
VAKRKPQNRAKLGRGRKVAASSVWCQCGKVAQDWTRGPEVVEGVRHAPAEIGGCGEAAPAAPVQPELPRKPDGTFAKGVSGNPGGRPKSIARIILEESEGEDGREIVRFFFGIMRGTEKRKAVAPLTGVEYDATPSFKESRQAGQWLGDQLFGKARQSIEVKNGDADPAAEALAAMTDEELVEAEALLARAVARAAEKAKASSGGEE